MEENERPAVRAATEADIPAITAIYADAVSTGTASYEIEPPDEAEMLARMQRIVSGGHPYLVAERGADVLGYAYAGPFHTRRAYRFTVENTVYVHKDARRQGIGRLLLAALVEEAETLGFRQMIAVIGDGLRHEASVGLHRAMGFELRGTITGSGFKFDSWLDTVWMQRALGKGNTAPPDREPGAPV